jgi:hypothetical protein
MERPDSSARSTSADGAPRSQRPQRGRRSLVIRRVTGAGLRQVHDGSIASPRLVHDRLCRIQSLTGTPGTLLHDAAARRGVQIRHSAARHGVVMVFPPGGGDAHPGHPLCGALMRWRGLIRQPAPAAGTNRASPPRGASRARKNRTAGMRGISQSGERPGARVTGQNGRGSAKRAVIRTASFARTLYTICTRTLPCIDP